MAKLMHADTERNGLQFYEIITIYLAAGAPLGVIFFQQLRMTQNRRSSLAAATGAWLVWPVSIVVHFSAPRCKRLSSARTISARVQAREDKIMRSARALTSALFALEDAFSETVLVNSHRQVTLAVHRHLARYIGLHLLLTHEENNSAVAPTKREMETCRIAGRKGDDLIIAGFCIRRRACARLLVQVARARIELIHTFAALGDFTDREAHALEQRLLVMRSVSEKTIYIYARAIEIFFLCDEQASAMMIASLLDVECARLHRLNTPEKDGDRQLEQLLQPATVERC